MGWGPALLAFGCVCPPSARDLLAVGFRSPEQTFATFQTAVRADEPTLEYRCFSAGFRARTQPPMSQFNYREIREVLRRENPLLRKGLADAQLDGPVERTAARARLIASSHGHRLAIELVLEDYAEIWAGTEPLVDKAIEFSEHTGTQSAADGSRWMYARDRLPEGVDAARVTELHFGREWKIDAIETVGDASPERRTAAPDP